MRAPHSNTGGTGTNAFQGEDLDVLADAVYSRRDEGNPRTICRPVIDAMKAQIARDSGDRTDVWRERDYDLTKIKAATLIAHGGNDFNVMTEQAAQLYAALEAQGTPRLFYFHQDGHGGDPPDFLTNLWFTKYLWGVDNGVETLARGRGSCASRRSARRGRRPSSASHSNTTTLTVASSAPFRVGLTLTVRRTSTTTAGDHRHPGRDARDARARGRRREPAARRSERPAAARRTRRRTPTWPDPGAADAVLKLAAAVAARRAHARGRLRRDRSPSPTTRASPTRRCSTRRSSANRLLYVTEPLPENVRISGSPRVSLRAGVLQAEGEPLGGARQPARVQRAGHVPHARLDRSRRTARRTR